MAYFIVGHDSTYQETVSSLHEETSSLHVASPQTVSSNQEGPEVLSEDVTHSSTHGEEETATTRLKEHESSLPDGGGEKGFIRVDFLRLIISTKSC